MSVIGGVIHSHIELSADEIYLLENSWQMMSDPIKRKTKTQDCTVLEFQFV